MTPGLTLSRTHSISTTSQGLSRAVVSQKANISVTEGMALFQNPRFSYQVWSDSRRPPLSSTAISSPTYPLGRLHRALGFCRACFSLGATSNRRLRNRSHVSWNTISKTRLCCLQNPKKSTKHCDFCLVAEMTWHYIWEDFPPYPRSSPL